MEAVRRIQFCAGHRVHKHESKCNNPHGHNYVVFFHAKSKVGLDKLGRVIDFSILKERLGGWIDKNWDHGFIYFKDDEEINNMFNGSSYKYYVMPSNPTAENMAEYLIKKICPKLLEDTNVDVVKVVLWETENCFVEASK